MLASAFVAIEAQRNALARDAAALQLQIQAGSAGLARQQAEIAEKQTDAYVMDRARDYGYVKPGEALIGVQRDPLAAVAAPPASGPSRMQKWLALFFGIR
jgi:cell division protein FtsB